MTPSEIMTKYGIDAFELERIYETERLATNALNGDKRAIVDLYICHPELFLDGTKTFTVLEPLLYEANELK